MLIVTINTIEERGRPRLWQQNAANTVPSTGDKVAAARSASLEGFGGYRRADNADV